MSVHKPVTGGDQLARRHGPVVRIKPPGGGGPGPEPPAGFTWYDGAYITRPAAGTTQDAFTGSDDFVLERDSGSAWVPWGPLFPMVEPPTTGWSWVNQGAATVDTTYGVIHQTYPAVAINQLRLRVRTMPSPPWSMTAAIVNNYVIGATRVSALALRDSAVGNIITWGLYDDDLKVIRWTSPTVAAATSWAGGGRFGEPLWLKIVDDSTNFTYYWSLNGLDWVQVLQEGRTAYLATPDQIGWGGQSSASGGTQDITLLSWVET